VSPFNGSHFTTLKMLEGFLKREQIKWAFAGTMKERLDALARGEVAAASLMEPWISVAEKRGMRVLMESHSTRSEAAGDELDGATLAAMFRAETRAAEAIDKDPRKHARYLIEEAGAFAQTVKIGFITSYSGLNGNLGPYMERGMRLYLKEHQKDLPPGVNIEFLIRDDTGPNPDKAKQLAQELIVRDKVNLLAGVIFTPNAMAIAPLATDAKVPFVIMNAGTAVITTRSPYIARLSFTLWQSCYPLGQWAAKRFKRAYTMVSDFGPGHDCEDAFVRASKEAGGEVAGTVRVPLVNPDFVPYMQRVKDAKPDALMVFIPAGKTATAVLKAFGDLGLSKAGIKLIGPGDVTTDEELENMGEAALGVLTVHHYSAAATRPANQAFVAAWKRDYG